MRAWCMGHARFGFVTWSNFGNIAISLLLWTVHSLIALWFGSVTPSNNLPQETKGSFSVPMGHQDFLWESGRQFSWWLGGRWGRWWDYRLDWSNEASFCVQIQRCIVVFWVSQGNEAPEGMFRTLLQKTNNKSVWTQITVHILAYSILWW